MTDALAPPHVIPCGARRDGRFGNPAQLHVVAVFFNFNRFKAPVANFHAFAAHMDGLGVTLHRVELVAGGAPFEVTDAANPHHTQLRTHTEFFQKENLANIGFRNAARLYPEARYFALIDADVRFFNKDVVADTMMMLERWPLGQMWSYALDLDPKGHPLYFAGQGTHAKRSFGYCYVNDVGFRGGYAGAVWHTGYAWAYRRETLEALGGLYEHAIIGAADYQMAWAHVGKPWRGIHGKASKAYIADARAWSANAFRHVQGHVGVVDGLIHHAWHGRKVNRRYVERWAILVDNDFDPAADLTRDFHGMLHLTGRNPKLIRDIRAYMAGRNEDDNTADPDGADAEPVRPRA